MNVRITEHVVLPARCRVCWVDGASGNGPNGRRALPRELRVDELTAAAPRTGLHLENGPGGIAVWHQDRGRILAATPPTEEQHLHALYPPGPIEAHLADPAGVPFPAELFAAAQITALVEDPLNRYLPIRLDLVLPQIGDRAEARANARVEVPLFPDAAGLRYGSGGGIEGQLAWDADRPAAYARVTVTVAGDVDWTYEAQCNATGLFRIPLGHTPAQALGAPVATFSVRATENTRRDSRIESDAQAQVRIATPMQLHYGTDIRPGVPNAANTVITQDLRPGSIGRLTSENLPYVHIATI